MANHDTSAFHIHFPHDFFRKRLQTQMNEAWMICRGGEGDAISQKYLQSIDLDCWLVLVEGWDSELQQNSFPIISIQPRYTDREVSQP